MPVISTRQLTKYYGLTKGIENVDLDVHRGEIFGFIGPNGAGKSTTIRLLMQLIQPTSGDMCVLGERIQAIIPSCDGASATCRQRSTTTNH